MRSTLALGLLLLAPLAAAQTVTPRGMPGTLDVASWNLEFFGTTSAGGSDTSPRDSDQFRHVKEVIRQGAIDVWAFQEVSDGADFVTLRDSISANGYAVVLGPNVSTPNTPFDQKLGFAINTSVITIRAVRTILNNESFNFAGRLPLELQVTAMIDGVSRDVRIITFHAKAGGTSDDRVRRAAASDALKTYTDNLIAQGTNVIVLGDFNDELTTSISGGPSPYANFVASASYVFATQQLNDSNTATFCGSSNTCGGSSTIDHILYSDRLLAAAVEGDRYGELLADLPNYTQTTSDHLPVLARFDLAQVVNAEEAPGRQPVALTAASPVRGTTTLTVHLESPAEVMLDVFDVQGRHVARLADGLVGPGAHPVRWDGAGLAPGLYLVRLHAGDRIVTRTVVRMP